MRRPLARFAVTLAATLIASAVQASGLSTNNIELWNQDSAGIAGTAEYDDLFASALASGDFDGDGYQDLAVGVPLEDYISGLTNDGVVQILFGSLSGLSARDQLWGEQSASPTNYNQYGTVLAAGDFDGDDTDDLAIGMPRAAVNGVSLAGAVEVRYGIAGVGLATNGMQRWHQDVTGIKGECASGDRFGSTLAAGDFDGDGFDDLAVGIPNEDVDSVTNCGALAILYGSAAGITDADDLWSQNSTDVADSCDTGDALGDSLAVGDFDGDGFDDVVAGIPDEDINGAVGAGAAMLLYGSAAGITAAGDLFLSQDAGIADTPELGDNFASSLAAGDLNGDGFDDLVIGGPGEHLGYATYAGVVHVLFGATGGLSIAGNQLWSQDSASVEGVVESSDYFGSSLAAGDFDRDGFDDLAIGAPREALAFNSAGVLHILPGSAQGPTASGSQLWHEDTTGVPGVSGEGNLFSDTLAAGDFNGDGAADLAIGIPSDLVNSATNAGSFIAMYGQAGGLWASAVNLGGGWKWLDWFGYFSDQGDGWIYHNQHGWMYAVGTTTADVWFWTQDLGWLWIADSLYPNLYRDQSHVWLWYQLNSVAPRWFYNYDTAQWEQH